MVPHVGMCACERCVPPVLEALSQDAAGSPCLCQPCCVTVWHIIVRLEVLAAPPLPCGGAAVGLAGMQ
eukprot:10031866-Lingulodinium_polyedra.AAC.1